MRFDHQKLSYQKRHQQNTHENEDEFVLTKNASSIFCSACRTEHKLGTLMKRFWSKKKNLYYYVCRPETPQEAQGRAAQEALARIKSLK